MNIYFVVKKLLWGREIGLHFHQREAPYSYGNSVLSTAWGFVRRRIYVIASANVIILSLKWSADPKKLVLWLCYSMLYAMECCRTVEQSFYSISFCRRRRCIMTKPHFIRWWKMHWKVQLESSTSKFSSTWHHFLLALKFQDCVQVPTDGLRSRESGRKYGVYDGTTRGLNPPINAEIKDGQWMGVEVQSQGEGGKVIVCAHRYVIYSLLLNAFTE